MIAITVFTNFMLIAEISLNVTKTFNHLIKFYMAIHCVCHGDNHIMLRLYTCPSICQDIMSSIPDQHTFKIADIATK